MREIGLSGLGDVARGAAVLGAGGGGDPYIGHLLAEAAITAHGPVTVCSMDEVPADAVVVPIALLGAPTVCKEKLPNGTEALTALRELERVLGVDVTHLVPLEIGGLNSMIPLAAAAGTGLPIVDGDAMGRAFPEAHMVLPSLVGIPMSPLVVADDKGNTVVVRAVSDDWAEKIARSVCVAAGCSVFIAGTTMRGHRLGDCLVPGTLGLAEQLGATVRIARAKNLDPVDAVATLLDGVVLFRGKVTDVERVTTGGFARGTALVRGDGADRGRELALRFQNEFLLALLDGRVLGSTPDLLCALETDTGEPVTTENIRYGHRITVLAVACDPRWRSPEGLRRVGPRYFGYDTDHRPPAEPVGRRTSV